MKKRILIYFTNFAGTLGGSEYLPLLFIAWFQKRGAHVTLALTDASGLDYIAQIADVPIDRHALDIVCIRPKSRLLRKLDAVLPFYRTRRLQKLARHADLCISTANMIDFGKPAHHFVYLMRHFGDNAFIDRVLHRPPLGRLARAKRLLRTFLAERFLRPALGMRSTRRILADPREHIYPNSFYVERTMRAFYGPFNATVFYPPTIFEFPPDECPARDPLLVVCLGRVIPEKRVTDVIDIVRRAREISGQDLKLRIAGPMQPGSPPSYVETLRGLAARHPWLAFQKPLYGRAKAQFLMSGTYAVHARRDEEFGIAVTEYLKAGDITIIPAEGGAREVVDCQAMTYETNDDGARILARCLADAAFREASRAHIRARATRFTRETYARAQCELLEGLMHA